MPVELIRSYYGDEIAIYFEWMNHFLKWIAVPAAFGCCFYILNQFFYDPSKSSLNAAYSIGMAFWGTCFAIFWLRRERGLKLLWDNIYSSKRDAFYIRENFVGEMRFNPITEA